MAWIIVIVLLIFYSLACSSFTEQGPFTFAVSRPGYSDCRLSAGKALSKTLNLTPSDWSCTAGTRIDVSR